MLIWAIAIVGPPESEDQLLKYLLRLMHKGAQIKVILSVFRDAPCDLCCGQLSLRALKSLREALAGDKSWNYQSSLSWWPHVAARLNHSMFSPDILDLHLSVVGSNFDFSYPRLHVEMFLKPFVNGNVYLDTSLHYLSVTRALFECPLVLGDISLQVAGFSTLKEAQMPTQIPCFGCSIVRKKVIRQQCGYAKEVIYYGQSSIDMTPNLSALLKTPTSPKYGLQICGFIDRPSPQLRGPSPTLLRAAEGSTTAFDALIQSLASQRQAAVVRFQKAGGHSYMATLNPIGYSNPEKLYLLMEPLPYSQDWPVPPMQFPVLEPVLVNTTLEALIDSLPELDSVQGVTNTPNGNYTQPGRDSKEQTTESESGHWLIGNPLADTIYNEILKTVINISPTVTFESVNALLVVDNYNKVMQYPGIQTLFRHHLGSYPIETIDLAFLDDACQNTLIRIHVPGDPSPGLDYCSPVPGNSTTVTFVIRDLVDSYPKVPVNMLIMTTKVHDTIAVCREIKKTRKMIQFTIREANGHEYDKIDQSPTIHI